MIAGSIPLLNLQEKMYYSFFCEYICYIIYPIYFELEVEFGTFSIIWSSSSNFDYIDTLNPTASAKL